MNRRNAAILTGILLVAAAGSLSAQTRSDIEVTRADIQADRKAIVAGNLPLSEPQAAAFWPLYREYRGEMGKIGDRIVKLIGDYASSYESLTDERAATLVTEFLAIQKDSLKLKDKYATRFNQALPAKSVMRFYQIENKLDAIIMIDLAAQIPLAK